MPYKETDIKGDFDLVPKPPGLGDSGELEPQEPKIIEKKDGIADVVGGLVDQLDLAIKGLRGQDGAEDIIKRMQEFRGEMIQKGSHFLVD